MIASKIVIAQVVEASAAVMFAAECLAHRPSPVVRKITGFLCTYPGRAMDLWFHAQNMKHLDTPAYATYERTCPSKFR